MNPNIGRVRKLESTISVCLLAVLFAIGLVVFVKQSYYDMSRFGVSPTQNGQRRQPPATLREETPALISFKPQGFNALTETEVFQPENLYEKINGKAPLYTDSGFVKLFTQRFINESDENLWMELFIYDMAESKNAFSVYSVQKRADAKTHSLFDSSRGYRTGNALYFIHGRYYIELIGSCESDELSKAITATAQNIKTELAVDKAEKIPELSLFPQENLVPGSTKLYLKNAFGFEGLSETFTAQYKINDFAIIAFISKRASITEAKRLAGDYRKFLIDNGAILKETTEQSFEGKTFDFYGTTEIVISASLFVGGVHEAENQQSAEKVAKLLIEGLERSQK
jgi:hypothetical protein